MSTTDEDRRRALRRMRVLATSLLMIAAVIFIVTRDSDGWLGYVNATAEAAMVGAIADWFAVTALFRHPLGIPIPHTAIIPRRKESLGESLQDFVVDNFLQAEVVRERIAAVSLAQRAGQWLQDGDHAERVVTSGARIAVHALGRVSDGDVEILVRDVLVPRLGDEPLGPAIGQLLAEVVQADAHTGLVDLVVIEAHHWLVEHPDEIAAMVADRAPWWTPAWVDEKVATRLHAEAVNWVSDVRDDPSHSARLALNDWLRQLAIDLQFDGPTRERADRLKQRVLAQPQVLATAVSLWGSLKSALSDSLAHEGVLRRRAVEETHALGVRLTSDERLAARVDEIAADVASYAVDRHGDEIATIISATVARWDGVETARRIELHVGPDLQFIRINGTLVGGLAGLLIHTLAQL